MRHGAPAGVGWALASLTAASAMAAEPAPPPAFAGPSVPTPPRQADPWPHPPTTLPADLLADVDLLFAQGMADPRGGEYRAVGVVTGTCWGEIGVTDTHAWVLPAAAAGAKQRFAVCWNGLVYPCVTVGGQADVAGDVHALLDTAKFQSGFLAGTDEASAISCLLLSPMKVLLLLRAGQTQLAEAYWPAVAEAATSERSHTSTTHDPYLPLARDWAWFAFDHAVGAHTRGDDVVGWYTGMVLANALPQIEARAAKLGYARPEPFGLERGGLPAVPYVDFVGQVPDLVADERRRVAQGPVVRVLDERKAYPDRVQRIAGLVRDLELVPARQLGPSGGMNGMDDPVIRALVAEGPAAVEPLIDCVANDDRLTRSVPFDQGSGRSRNLVPVRRVAYAILKQIMQTDSFGPVTGGHGKPGTRAAAAAAAEGIRAYCAKARGKPLAERWFDVLADDAAGPDRWVDAAGRIVEGTNVQREGGGWIATSPLKPGERAPIKGEPLRGKRNPSVAELMAKRVPAVAAVNDGWLFAQDQGAELALDLDRWDANAAVPVLRERLRQCMAASDADRQKLQPGADSEQSTQTTEQMAKDVGELTTALAGDGDAQGVRLYRAWVVHQTPAMPGSNVAALLQPIWRHPDDATLAAAADELFNGPRSPWRCLPTAVQFRDWGRPSLMASPMFGVPAFGKHVARNLDDVTVIGSASVKEDQLSVEAGSVGWGSGGVNTADPLLPKPAGTKVSIRVCDWYAYHVAQLDGAPPFQLYWPVANRDAQRPKLAAFLARWGDRLRYSPLQAAVSTLGDFEDDAGHLTFPRLDRPATAADVAGTSAIFALTGGPVRVVPMPTWPAKAKWTADHDYPVQYPGGTDPKSGVTRYTTDFLNDGIVWQAEEVRVDGKWQRFYGFVGPHVIAQVPAEQIEFAKQ